MYLIYSHEVIYIQELKDYVQMPYMMISDTIYMKYQLNCKCYHRYLHQMLYVINSVIIYTILILEDTKGL